MSLVADYGSSSESGQSDQSDSSSSSCNSFVDNITPANFIEKLPKPNFTSEQSEQDKIENSVFANPFKEAENAKQAILEKHVKMVKSRENVTTINGKRICWNFRKGKCRFGHNCIYAHDSDVQKSPEQLLGGHLIQMDSSHTNISQIGEAVQSSEKKRKRPGLTEGIIPGKKVLKDYQKQKSKLI